MHIHDYSPTLFSYFNGAISPPGGTTTLSCGEREAFRQQDPSQSSVALFSLLAILHSHTSPTTASVLLFSNLMITQCMVTNTCIILPFLN